LFQKDISEEQIAVQKSNQTVVGKFLMKKSTKKKSDFSIRKLLKTDSERLQELL
jgi:peroxiredoxin family protein